MIETNEFICRICGNTSFYIDVVNKLYNCSSCGVVFKDPSNFSLQKIQFTKLSEHAIEPKKAHNSDTGFDLYAAEEVIIAPGETRLVPTNISMKYPLNLAAQIRPRSGMSSKGKRISLGTIDQSYRGDIKVCMINTTSDDYIVEKHSRIAQLVFEQIIPVTLEEIDLKDFNPNETERGITGFGNSGKF